MKDYSRIPLIVTLGLLFFLAFNIDLDFFPNFYMHGWLPWVIFGFVIWLFARGGCCGSRNHHDEDTKHEDDDA